MTENVSHETMEPFKNPDLLPLEKLKLEIHTDGIIRNVDALSARWASDRYFLHYEAPNIYNDDGSEIVGAKNHWTEIANYMINDLRWLLSLPFYRFWSNIVYNTSIVDTLVSFLQEAPPFYALENFPNCPKMQGLLEKLRYYVLMVFTRLVTNKNSDIEYISNSYLGNLLYEKYIFTVPIIFDLCQLYGRENEKIMKRMLNCLFILAPQYNSDLEKTIPCLIQALENVEVKFNCCSTDTNEAVSLSNRNTTSTKLTLFNLEDMILYVLDIVSTITVFLKNYHPAVSLFHREDFLNKIVSIYENTIPEMYKILHKLAYSDQTMPKYAELKHRLDVTRIEILHLFRIIIYEPILNIHETLSTLADAEIKARVDDYLNLLNNAIAEKEFITDYVQFSPVITDLNALSKICPEIDKVKCKYILQSITATIGNPSGSSTSSTIANEAVAGPSNTSNQASPSKVTSSLNGKRTSNEESVKLASLISEVKDILCDLDEEFIKLCLQHFDYNIQSVVNAILEGPLPPELKSSKEVGSLQVSSSSLSNQEAINYEDITYDMKSLNVRNNYSDVHVKTPEVIEVSKDYIIKNYSLIDEYDDEYDDTYDNHDIRGITQDTDIHSRPFTVPRVLLEKQTVETIDELESEHEDVETEQNGKDHFLQNPAELRAQAEQRRQAMQSRKASPNVIGNRKGKGQENDVLHNRHQKNVQKEKRANHNRRSGASWKRHQGMIPS